MKIFFTPTKFTLITMITVMMALSGCNSSSKSSSSTQTISASKPAVANSKRALAPHVTRTGEIILLRGLANVFSKGMDVIGDRLKAKGVDARVYNHAAWENLATDLITRSKRKAVSYPIIIMGHSLGANASLQMATYLGKHGIPVSYVVAFDPTVANYVGPKVRRVVNYYLPNGKNRVRRGNGFKGKLSNIDVSNIYGIKHTTVEKNRKLQNHSIDSVMRLVKKRRRT